MQTTTIRIQASSPPKIDQLSIAATAPVEITAAAEGAEGPKRPRFAITGYTGAVMQVAAYYTPVIVDLNGLKAASQSIPILRSHDHDRIVGQSETVQIDASGVRIEGTITGDNDDAREVVSQSKNGFRWQASIGADVIRQEFLKSGEKAVVNGREVVGPLVIAREARLRETSFVALGADGQTTATVAASNPTSIEGDRNMSFEDWLKAKGFDPASLSAEQKGILEAAFQAGKTPPTPTPAPTPVPTPTHTPSPTPAAQSFQAMIEAQRKDEQRVAAISEITARYLAERPALVDEIEKLGKAAIEAKNTTPDEYELMLMRNLRASAGFAIQSHGQRKASAKVIEAAICLSAGLNEPEKAYDAQTLEAASERFRHGLGLTELLLMAARENGHHGVSPRDVRGLLRAAFAPIQATGFSTFDLSGILSNSATKFMVDAYNAVESGWREISSRRSVTDFKTYTTYSLTGDLKYEKLSPAGEIPHGTIGEEAHTNKADTYAKMLAITRADIINDDLGAFQQVPTKLGRGAALKMNDVFWTVFLAGVGSNFWHTSNNNVVTGSNTVLASEGLKLATTKFRKQTDPDGEPLGITPRILLVPPELEFTADELMTATAVNTGGSSTTDKVPNTNVWRSKYRVVTSTYLSNTTFTGYSLTAWWLLADPRDLSTVEVALLNGREMPIIESADADFDKLGIQMRGYHDFGVALQNKRASVRAAGA